MGIRRGDRHYAQAVRQLPVWLNQFLSDGLRIDGQMPMEVFPEGRVGLDLPGLDLVEKKLSMPFFLFEPDTCPSGGSAAGLRLLLGGPAQRRGGVRMAGVRAGRGLRSGPRKRGRLRRWR
ncbi:hypothetical protein GCM10020000_87270 [Streptomyces olivoverticillatus]